MPLSNASSTALVLNAIRGVLDEGSIAALVTLTTAPTPDDVGKKLVVPETGLVVGSLGDANLDLVVAKRAIKFLESRDDAHLFRVGDFAPELTGWAEATVLFERLQPEPRLVICGAGHVGAALARLANFIGYKATLIDDRAEFVTREHFPDERIELVAASDWATAVRDAIGNGHGVSVAVVTRGHNEDEECLRAVMTTDADYVGLIGSKRRTNIVLARLREAGIGTDRLRHIGEDKLSQIGEDRLSQVHAPVGLDIGAVTPEEVALSILAEIVAVRRGGKGGSLSAWRRR